MIQTKLPGQFGGPDIVTLEAAISELLAAKRGGNKTERYVKSLGHYLKQFSAGREQTPISDFTFSDVESWLSRYSCADTRRTWLSRLSPLFSFAVRRGYVDKNPCDRVERVTVDRKPPVVLTPCQSRELLRATPTVMKPYVVLGMFGGLRPEEIPKLDWSEINLDAGTVVATGKRRRRLVTLEPVAIKLLKEHPLKSGPVCPSNSTVDRWRAKAKAVLGFEEWPQDLLRHTAASYLLTLVQDAGKVATRLGNSVKVLNAHYLNPPSKSDCAAFWQLDGNKTSYPVTLADDSKQSAPCSNGQIDRHNQSQSHPGLETASEGAGQTRGQIYQQIGANGVQTANSSVAG